MGKTTDSIVRILATGGGLIIDCKGKTTDSLVKIAATANKKGGTVILINLEGKTIDSLVRIGAAGKNNVIMDIRE